MVKYNILLWLSLGLFSIGGHTLTVEEAYRQIPHAQTTYLSSKSNLDKALNTDLERMFALVDQGVVARFESYRNLYNSKSAQSGIKSYKKVIADLTELKVAKSLHTIKKTIIDSMTTQVLYLEEWSRNQENKNTPFNPGHPQVQKSSNSLRAAYARLTSLFPKESEHNRKAFFDHLCALDFI